MVALSSLLISSIFIGLILGFNSLTVSFSQITYWSKVSGLFTSLPYPSIRIFFTEILNWLPIFLQSLTLTILCLKFRTECLSLGKQVKTFLLENGVPIFIFLGAIMYMRVALGRSDSGHLKSSGFFAIFSFVTLLGRHVAKQQTYKFSWFSSFLAFLVACSLFNLKSVVAAVDVFSALRYPASVSSLLSNKNTDLIDPQYIEAAQQIKNDVVGQSCFYTLTSEGIWYRIFRVPPCSKYYYLVYSTTTESQKELVRELEENKPKIILYSNQSLGNELDGVSKETSHLLVHQYIWQHYCPYKHLNGNWFWIRRDSTNRAEDSALFVPLPNQVSGSFDTLTSLDSNH